MSDVTLSLFSSHGVVWDRSDQALSSWNSWMDSLGTSRGGGLGNHHLLRVAIMFCLLCANLDLSGGYEAPKQNITVFCANISTAIGFTYPVQTKAQSLINSGKVCDYGWYNEKNELLAYRQDDGIKPRHPLVVDENPDNLTLSQCIDVHHRVVCDQTGKKFNTDYHVIKDSTYRTLDGMPDPSSHPRPIIDRVVIVVLVLLVVLVVVGILIWNKRRKSSEKDPAVNTPMLGQASEDVHLDISGHSHNGSGSVNGDYCRGAA